MAKRRNFTPEFKAEVVLEALRGQTSQAEPCRCHNISENQVSTWKRKPFLENTETFFESPEKYSDASSGRIAQLEQSVHFKRCFLIKPTIQNRLEGVSRIPSPMF